MNPTQYDFTQVKIDPNTGRVLTGEGQSVDKGYISDRGYLQAVNFAKQSNLPKSEVSSISSIAGSNALADSVNKQQSLTYPKTNTTAQTTPVSANVSSVAPTKVKLINPATAQEVTFDNAESARNAIQTYLDAGFQTAEATGNIPSWLKPSTVTKISQAEQAVKTAEQERDDLVNKLKNLDVSNDPALQSSLAGITNQWNQRISEMQRANQSRLGAINTTGIRIGSRYTGGMGGAFGGIVAEEERQAVDRIASLEAQKQEALANATAAYRNNKWSEYAKFVDFADKRYQEQVAKLGELNKIQSENNKMIAERVNKQEEEFRKSITDVILNSAKNGLTDPETIANIQNSKSLGEAVAYAGDYLNSGTGIVGEYAVYKRDAQSRGLNPISFDEYQTRDANRKVAVARAGNASGLPAQTVAQIDAIAKSFDSSPIVKQYNETQNKYLSIAGVVDSGIISGAGDLQLIFEFMKSLDPNSVVRESEYDTASKAANPFKRLAARIGGYVDKGQILPQDVRDEFKRLSKMKLDVIGKQYDNLYNESARKINIKTGSNDGQTYLTDYKAPTVGQELIAQQNSASDTVYNHVQSNPQIAGQVEQLIAQSNGDAVATLEYMKLHPEVFGTISNGQAVQNNSQGFGSNYVNVNANLFK